MPEHDGQQAQAISEVIQKFIDEHPQLFTDEVIKQIIEDVGTTPIITQLSEILKTEQLKLTEYERNLSVAKIKTNNVNCALKKYSVKLEEKLNETRSTFRSTTSSQQPNDILKLFFIVGVVVCMRFVINRLGGANGGSIGCIPPTSGGKSKPRSPISKNTHRKSNPMDYYVHQYVQLGGTLNDDKEIQKFVKDSYKKYPELKKKVVEMYTI